MSLPRFGRYLPRCTTRLITPKVGTAINILLESYPCSPCDKMRLGHLRFLAKAKTVTGRRPRQAGQTWPQPKLRHIPKAREDLFPVVGLGDAADGLESRSPPCRRSIRGPTRRPYANLGETAATCVASLTSRQRQILDLVGHPSKNIAADLGISQGSVDTIARQ
jgi:hypothetical protein